MPEIYAKLICKGVKRLEEVPAAIRDEVAAILAAMEGGE